MPIPHFFEIDSIVAQSGYVLRDHAPEQCPGLNKDSFVDFREDAKRRHVGRALSDRQFGFAKNTTGYIGNDLKIALRDCGYPVCCLRCSLARFKRDCRFIEAMIACAPARTTPEWWQLSPRPREAEVLCRTTNVRVVCPSVRWNAQDTVPTSRRQRRAASRPFR